jgi:hypothetical protein
MKFTNILLLSLVLILVSSCSEEYKMKKEFKKAYSEIMKDPDSYELISFEIFQNASEYSEENEWFLYNYEELKKHKHRKFEEVWDSIHGLETKRNAKFGYTGALVKIKGTNSYGAKVTSEHIAYYSDIDIGGRLKEIDGDYVSNNKIHRGFKND